MAWLLIEAGGHYGWQWLRKVRALCMGRVRMQGGGTDFGNVKAEAEANNAALERAAAAMRKDVQPMKAMETK